jgi:UDP-glucose 4-epimerase
MRVMVTGATAPLGAELVGQLLGQPDVSLVLAVGRKVEGTASAPRLVYCATDLTHSRAVHDLIHGPAREHAIDTVVHAAQHRSAHDGGQHVHAQNVEAARALVIACADHPTIRRLVYRSFSEVYAQPHATTSLLDEEAPLDFDPAAPQWLRDRVEADLTVCAHLGGPLQIAVLRCAEVVAPGHGSQLWDYLSARLCLRPIGFDPMINVLAAEDAAAALVAAVRSTSTGVFNIPGLDTLPLTRAIVESNRADIPIPGALMAPMYTLRRAVKGGEFRYDLNVRRFHFGGVLAGGRARLELGYAPRSHVRWPRPWWRVLFDRLAERQ